MRGNGSVCDALTGFLGCARNDGLNASMKMLAALLASAA
jgi:hypothetical protein